MKLKLCNCVCRSCRVREGRDPPVKTFEHEVCVTGSFTFFHHRVDESELLDTFIVHVGRECNFPETEPCMQFSTATNLPESNIALVVYQASTSITDVSRCPPRTIAYSSS